LSLEDEWPSIGPRLLDCCHRCSPAAQVHNGAGSFIDQHRFGVENAELVYDLSLGIWQWRVLPTFSQIQRDSTRILHARMGHLPLEPSVDCLCYCPLAGGKDDMGVGGLDLVQTDSAESQGTWGVYKLALVGSWRSGLLMEV